MISVKQRKASALQLAASSLNPKVRDDDGLACLCKNKTKKISPFVRENVNQFGFN